MVVIFIELKAREKRTAISAGVSWRGPKEMSAGLIGKLAAVQGGGGGGGEDFRTRRSINQSAPHKPGAINHGLDSSGPLCRVSS